MLSNLVYALYILAPGSSRDNWQIQLNFINSIIDGLVIGDDETRVGMVTFSDRAKLRWTLDSHKVRT